jgi:hypothetical protein
MEQWSNAPCLAQLNTPTLQHSNTALPACPLVCIGLLVDGISALAGKQKGRSLVSGAPD